MPDTRIILASASPRRRELLEQINLRAEIVPALAPELPHPELTPPELVRELSRAKAAEVAAKNPGALVIGADTVVCVDGAILGKPADETDARRMLARLSGREHEVFTGVTVIKDGAERGFTERTAVRFRAMSAEEIAAYAATGEGLDKAGAYGIQGLGSQFIESIDGDYFNVMGLPLCRLGLILKALGVKLL